MRERGAGGAALYGGVTFQRIANGGDCATWFNAFRNGIQYGTGFMRKA
jgi:hypothetical protein